MLTFFFYLAGAAAQACALVMQHAAHFDRLAKEGGGRLDAFDSCRAIGGLAGVMILFLAAFSIVPEGLPFPILFFVIPPAILFPIVCAAVLAHDTLPEVNEHMLLTVTISFWSAYAPFLMAHPEYDSVLPILLGVPGVASVAVAFLAFTHLRIGDPWRYILYSWYLFALAFILLLHIPLVDDFAPMFTWILSGSEATPPFSPILALQVFVFAGACTFISVRAMPLIVWISWIPGKKETWSTSLRRFREQKARLASRYSSSQLGLTEAALILVVQGGIVGGNLLFGWAPPGLVTGLCITVIPQALERHAEAARHGTIAPLDPVA